MYDAVVVDAPPPTGRIGSFLDVTKAMADLAKGGPVHSQSEGVVRLLHSPETVVHLVALLEALPVQETADAAAELARDDLNLGAIIVNRAARGSCPKTNSPVLQPATSMQLRSGRRSPMSASICPTTTSPACSPRRSSTRRCSKLKNPVRRSSARSTARGCNFPHSPTASISVGSTSWPNTSRNRACDDRDHRERDGRQFQDRPTRSSCLDISAIIKDPTARIVVCCGAGGVGKTTTAASLALRAAEEGRRVVVLTIDPARRLAQALGVAELDNTPQPVKLGPEATGELHAMMLNMRRTFDEMVIEHSSPEKAEQILANPFYQTVATSFSGTQEYMAMEKLGQLASNDAWDLVIVDTPPPSRNALDFLDAPQRLGTFLDGRMIRLLSAPGRGLTRLVAGAMGLALKGVSTIVGSQMLSDASAFVQSLDSMFGGFRERATKTYELLRQPGGTHFLVIAAAEPDALREAAFFVDRLAGDSMPLAGLVLNRTHPTLTALPADHAVTAADKLEAKENATEAEALTAAVLRIHAHRAVIAKREIALLSRFTAAHPRVPLIGVPSLPFEVSDLEALRAVGDQLTRKG